MNDLDNDSGPPRKPSSDIKVWSTAPDVMVYWPSWYYDPATGLGEVFACIEEVPEGWVDDHNLCKRHKTAPKAAAEMKHDDPGKGPEELEDIDDISVADLKTRLTYREIAFARTASKPQLYELLSENY